MSHLPKKRLSREEAINNGRVPLTEEHYRSYYLVCYLHRYDEPPEEDWDDIIKTIQLEVGGTRKAIKSVFEKAQNGDFNATRRKKGTGRPLKLDRNTNPGLVAAALALNVGVPPTLAVNICNSVNEKEGNDVSVCRNTLMSTINAYTDMQKTSILQRKTGSKDPDSNWANARYLFVSQLQEQFRLGEEINKGSLSIADCKDVHPLCIDGILQVDQSHTKCTIGGSGHDGPGAGVQWRVAVDSDSLELMPVKKVLV